MTEQKSVEDRVGEYLKKSGFPLEVQVAGLFQRVLHNARFNATVSQRVSYAGEDELGKPIIRETDVTVALEMPLSVDNIHFQTRLVIECKSSRSVPWILFRSPDRRIPNPPDRLDPAWYTFHGEQLRTPAARAAKLGRVTGTVDNDLLDTRLPHSTGAESADDKHQSGVRPNRARDAIRQVLSAASVFRGLDQQQIPIDYPVLGVVVPIVVTSAPLFVVTSSPDGTYTYSRTPRELVIGQFLPFERDRPVWVVDEAGIEELANEFLRLQSRLGIQA